MDTLIFPVREHLAEQAIGTVLARVRGLVLVGSIQELLSLKTDLANAQSDLVKASADYNSMIRESKMVELMNEKHLGLTAPLDPPYQLKSK